MKFRSLTRSSTAHLATLTTRQGRKQLLEETKELAAPYVSSVKEYSSDKVAPYISSVKEYSSPYVAKLEELRRSERIEAMVEAFKEAREHPTEKVEQLKAKAVDLIKYESLRSYRDHVLSAEFQADTARLVKELPVVATEAAKRGAESLKASATALAEELDAHKATVKSLVAQGKEYASSVDLDVFKVKVATMSAALLAQMNEEVSGGVEQYKLDGFSLVDFLERLKRLGSAVVVEGKVLLGTNEEAAAEAEATAEDATEARGDAAAPAAEEPVGGLVAEPSATHSEGDVYEDASEDTIANLAGYSR